jgi:hypothetical protein
MISIALAAMLAVSLSSCANALGGASGAAPPAASTQMTAEKAYTVAGRTVYGVRAAYEAALTAAVAYAKLPRCAPASAAGTCSDQKIVDQLLKARDVAREATSAAENAVRSKLSGNIVQDAAAAADAAVKAFVNITNSLKG